MIVIERGGITIVIVGTPGWLQKSYIKRYQRLVWLLRKRKDRNFYIYRDRPLYIASVQTVHYLYTIERAYIE